MIQPETSPAPDDRRPDDPCRIKTMWLCGVAPGHEHETEWDAHECIRNTILWPRPITKVY